MLLVTPIGTPELTNEIETEEKIEWIVSEKKREILHPNLPALSSTIYSIFENGFQVLLNKTPQTKLHLIYCSLIYYD